MQYIFISLILLLSIFLEATVVHLPLVLLALLSLVVVFQTQAMFFIALFAGLILDSLLMRQLGLSSLFFIAALLLIFLYKQKFEIKTMSFIIFISFFASTWYLLLFGHQLFFIQLPVSVGIGLLFFFLFSWLENRFSKPQKMVYNS